MKEQIAGRVVAVAKLLEKYGTCPQTTREILDIAEELKKDAFIDFEKLFSRYVSLFDLLEGEFVESAPVSMEGFRKGVFQEISLIVVRALSLGLEYHDIVKQVVQPISRRLKDVENYLIPVSMFGKRVIEEFSDTRENRVVFFHLKAYSYLVLVEGIFDDLTRLLYFFKKLAEGQVLRLSNLERIDVKMVTRIWKPRPFFLISWEERCSWRNSIAHANAHYDPDKETIRFISLRQLSQEVEYDETVSMADFLIGNQQLVDTLAAYILNMELVSIFWELMHARLQKQR